MSVEQATSILRELAVMCRQGERGFASAAAAVRTADVREALQRYARQRSRLAGELEHHAARLSTGETTAAVRPLGAWSDSPWAGNLDDSVVLAECVRSEGITRERFERALGHDLPLNVKMVLLRQYTEIKSALLWLRRSELAANAREHALS